MSNSITVNGITYYKEPPLLEKAKKTIESYEWIKHDILSGVENARALYDDYKQQGLSAGMIEAEGYLRAFVQMEAVIKESERDMK
jgi:hypothetical protein